MGKSPPNPRRVAAGKENRKRRGPLTPEGRLRLGDAARRHRPWDHATGPRSPAGKIQAAKNGKLRRLGPRSVREVRAEMAELLLLLKVMEEVRRDLGAEEYPAERKRQC
jgi:hypothetical protein